MVPLSVLDLAPIVAGATAGDALRNSRDLARHAERLGYARYWLAEHHNMPGIASAATSVVIGYVAEGTSRIRVGAGGIMLPNHSPLVIAEQFGTLDALYPGRIDLGLGRAPGTDPRTAHALRRDALSADTFADDVLELQAYLSRDVSPRSVNAVPGRGSGVPIWLLGSSLYGASLAAALGLPFAFASHFAPALVEQALSVYRTRFQPSPELARPHAMIAVNAFAAATDEEARRLFTSVQQAVLALRRGRPVQLPPPVDALSLDPSERAIVDDVLAYSVAGSPATVRAGLERILERTNVDELLLTANIFDHAARKRSFELVAGAFALTRGAVPA